MRTLILVIDSLINLLLGFGLLLFPPALVRFLGIPATDTVFYPSIFGAVLIGIGIALFLLAFFAIGIIGGLVTGDFTWEQLLENRTE